MAQFNRSHTTLLCWSVPRRQPWLTGPCGKLAHINKYTLQHDDKMITRTRIYPLFAEFVHLILVSYHALLHSYPHHWQQHGNTGMIRVPRTVREFHIVWRVVTLYLGSLISITNYYLVRLGWSTAITDLIVTLAVSAAAERCVVVHTLCLKKTSQLYKMSRKIVRTVLCFITVVYSDEQFLQGFDLAWFTLLSLEHLSIFWVPLCLWSSWWYRYSNFLVTYFS